MLLGRAVEPIQVLPCPLGENRRTAPRLCLRDWRKWSCRRKNRYRAGEVQSRLADSASYPRNLADRIGANRLDTVRGDLALSRCAATDSARAEPAAVGL